jgi:hypothetical protein
MEEKSGVKERKMESTRNSSYGIKTEYDNGKVCIQTSRVYLDKEEFENWVQETRSLMRDDEA